MQLVGKLSAKSVIGNIKKHIPRDSEKEILIGEEKVLFRVYGNIEGFKVGETNFGEFTEFQGNFEAVAIDTGEVFRSAKCFLPSIAEALLLPVVKNPDNVGGVRFAFDIGIKGSAKEVGYEYTVRPIVEMTEADPLAALRSSLPPMLEAPKTDKGEKDADKTESDTDKPATKSTKTKAS